MSRYKVLVTAPYFLPVLEDWRSVLESRGCEIVPLPVPERAEEEDLLPIIADVDGVICGDDRFTSRVLEQAQKLRVLSKWGTGVDSLDHDACRRLDIQIRNTADAFSVPVADTVIGYALAFCRNIPFLDAQMKSGIWKKIPGRALSECTFGIVGVGNVGRRVAERAAAFGCELLGCDLKIIDSSVRSSTGLKQVSFEQLLGKSDIVSINCDLNPTSRKLMNKNTFGWMKSTAVLINTARGPIINENDMVRALETGQISGAGLDVFEDEPLPADSPLRRMQNVLIAPHNSNSSPIAWTRVHENTVKNLLEVLEGKNLRV